MLQNSNIPSSWHSHSAHTPAVAFSIGNWEIHTYALTMLLGFILAIGSIGYFWHKRGYSFEILEIMIIVIVPASIIGARIWYVLGDLSKVDASNWFAFWEGGLAIQGGVTFSGIAGFGVVWMYRHQVDWHDVAGIVFPAVLIGQAVGRWGNFANHEVFGRPTSYEAVSWLGNWIASNMYIGNDIRVPLFFYEFLTSIVGYVLLFWVAQLFLVKRCLKPGVPAGAYFVWYGIVRASMETLRDPSDIMKWGSLDISVFASVVYIVGGLALIIYFQFGTKRYSFINNKWTLKTYQPLAKIEGK